MAIDGHHSPQAESPAQRLLAKGDGLLPSITRADLLRACLAFPDVLDALEQQISHQPNRINANFIRLVDPADMAIYPQAMARLLDKILLVRPDLAPTIWQQLADAEFPQPQPVFLPLLAKLVAAHPDLRSKKFLEKNLNELECLRPDWWARAHLLAAVIRQEPNLISHREFSLFARRVTHHPDQARYKDALLGVMAEQLLQQSTPPAWWNISQRRRQRGYHVALATGQQQGAEFFPAHQAALAAKAEAQAELDMAAAGTPSLAPQLLRDAAGNPLIELADLVTALDDLAMVVPPIQIAVSPMGHAAFVQPAPALDPSLLTALRQLIFADAGLLAQCQLHAANVPCYAPAGGQLRHDDTGLPIAEQADGRSANILLRHGDISRLLLCALRDTRLQTQSAPRRQLLDLAQARIQNKLDKLADTPQEIWAPIVPLTVPSADAGLRQNLVQATPSASNMINSADAPTHQLRL